MSRVLFGGKALREPTAASQLRIGVQPSVNPNPTNRVAVIGPSEGGVPNQVYTFSSFAAAKDVLRGGDSLRAISYIFNPSPTFPGASQVDFVRADAAVGSARQLSDGAGTPKLAIRVSSVDSGKWTNGILVKVEASAANRVVTLKVPSPAFQGGADGVATTVSSNHFFSSPSAKFLSRGTRQNDVILLANGTMYVVDSVVSETQVKIAGAVTPASALSWEHVRYNRTQRSPELAPVAGTEGVNTNVVEWINTNAGDVVTAELLVSDAGMVAATGGDLPLTGGTTGVMTNSELVSALQEIRDLEVTHIYVAKACEAGNSFAGTLLNHIQNEATMPALGYVGAPADTTVENALAFAGTLNSGRLVYTMQTVFDSALDGLGVEEVPGYLLAAKVAGLAAGLPAQTPLTRKPVSVLGVKPLPAGKVLDRETRESMLKAGILHLFQPVGSATFVVNQGVTTLQKNDEPWDASSASSSEISLMRITDTILTDLRLSAAATFIGASSTLAKPVVVHFVQSYLESQVGNLIQDYSSITVTQTQDKWFVQFGIAPAYPINFILITGTVIA
jgi:hypothetical protein